MASRTAASTVKRKNKHAKAGRPRKNRLALILDIVLIGLTRLVTPWRRRQEAR